MSEKDRVPSGTRVPEGARAAETAREAKLRAAERVRALSSREDDLRFMAEAIREAEKAAERGEVPVGAVIVRYGKILARAHNRRETDRSAAAHAELLCVEEACRLLGGWRLTGCTLYVTLEPCPMCAGAVINARVPRVVYGAKDYRAGALGSLIDLSAYPLGFRPAVEPGVLAEESLSLLRTFFASKRTK